jgi:hypothetical protein
VVSSAHSSPILVSQLIPPQASEAVHVTIHWWLGRDPRRVERHYQRVERHYERVEHHYERVERHYERVEHHYERADASMKRTAWTVK